MLISPEPEDRSSIEQILQQERLITSGRLISSIVQEINNPLQAIRGALALALEDIENPRELREYILISQQEIEHITVLLNQVRLIYRAPNDQPDLFPLSVLFRDAIELTREETMRQKVKINNRLPSNSPLVEAVYNHLYIVVLRTILAFTDIIGGVGGGELLISAEDTPSQLQISFATHAPIAVPNTTSLSELPGLFNLAFTDKLVALNGGVMRFHSKDTPIILRIDLPTVS